MRPAVFWDLTRRWVVVMYRRFGTRIGPIFFLDFLAPEDRTDRCTETSVNNYHTTPRNIQEQHKSRQNGGWSPKSLIIIVSVTLQLLLILWRLPLDMILQRLKQTSPGVSPGIEPHLRTRPMLMTVLASCQRQSFGICCYSLTSLST
jgi:hypothetical protein